MASTVVAEKTEEELRKEIDELRRQQPEITVKNNSKDLLDLEANPRTISSSSTIESKLFVFKKDVSFSSSHAPLQKPAMSSLPKSQVLGKVKDFLGVFSESNKRLMEDAKEHPQSYDIEVMSGNESKYIEMDLMLGIADLHTPEAIAAAESAIAGYQNPLQLAESCSDEDSSDDEEEEGEDNNQEQDIEGGTESGLMKVAERQSSSQESKKQQPKKRSKIVEIA